MEARTPDPTPEGNFDRIKRWCLGALWYLANAGGVAALYFTRVLG